MNNKIKRIFLPGYLVLSCFVFGSVYIPPGLCWPASFLGFLVPVFILSNMLIAGYLIFTQRSAGLTIWIVSGLLVGMALPSLWITYRIDYTRPGTDKTISLLSFNAKLFRETEVYDRFSMEMIDWIEQDSSQIKCLQEFSTNARWEVLDIKKRIEAEGYFSYTYKAADADLGDHDPGMAIFSVFPIVNAGIVDSSRHKINAIIFADIALKTDTIRVYNVHLSSFRFDLVETSSVFAKISGAMDRVKWSVLSHQKELHALLQHHAKSPYPAVIAGDFNEMPYSHVYVKMSRHFVNAFEAVGDGFGFTFIKPPVFLRIDHVFLEDGIQAIDHQIDYQMNISDHYPVRFDFRMQ